MIIPCKTCLVFPRCKIRVNESRHLGSVADDFHIILHEVECVLLVDSYVKIKGEIETRDFMTETEKLFMGESK